MRHKKLYHFGVVATVLATGIGLVFAGAIEDRRAIMKGVGAATKTGTALAKGELPFDAAKAKEVLQVYVDAAGKMPGLFPEDSKTGGETSAAPKIWEDMEGFKAAFAKWSADAEAAKAATDTASFAAAFAKVTANCGSCHQTYRLKKS